MVLRHQHPNTPHRSNQGPLFDQVPSFHPPSLARHKSIDEEGTGHSLLGQGRLYQSKATIKAVAMAIFRDRFDNHTNYDSYHVPPCPGVKRTLKTNTGWHAKVDSRVNHYRESKQQKSTRITSDLFFRNSMTAIKELVLKCTATVS